MTVLESSICSTKLIVAPVLAVAVRRRWCGPSSDPLPPCPEHRAREICLQATLPENNRKANTASSRKIAASSAIQLPLPFVARHRSPVRRVDDERGGLLPHPSAKPWMQERKGPPGQYQKSKYSQCRQQRDLQEVPNDAPHRTCSQGEILPVPRCAEMARIVMVQVALVHESGHQGGGCRTGYSRRLGIRAYAPGECVRFRE